MIKQNSLRIWMFLAVLLLVPVALAFPQLTMPNGNTATSDPTPTPWVNYSSGMVPLLSETSIVSGMNTIVAGTADNWDLYDSNNGCLPCDSDYCVVWCHSLLPSGVELPTGEYKFRTQAYDGYNPSQLYEIDFYIDRTNPVEPEFVQVMNVQFEESDGIIYTAGTDFNIEMNAEEEAWLIWDSGQIQMGGDYNPINPTTISATTIGPFLPVANTATLVEFEVQDLLYNNNFTNLTFYYDTASPVISNEHPADTSYTGDSSPLIYADISDVGVGIDEVRMSVETSQESFSTTCSPQCTGPFSWNGSRVSFSETDLAVGTQTDVAVTVSATDYFTQSSEDSWDFTIDTDLPYVVNFELQDDYLDESKERTYSSNNSSTVTITMNDESELTDFRLMQGSTELEGNLSDFTSSDNLVWSGAIADELNDGDYTVEFTGQKYLSDNSLGAPQNFDESIGIDQTPPIISNYVVKEAGATQPDRAVEYGQPITLEVQVTDSLGVNSVQLTIVNPNGVSSPAETMSPEESVFQYNITPTLISPGVYDYAPGDYDVRVSSSDLVGNVVVSYENFSINDTTKPVMVFYEPKGNVTTIPTPMLRLNTSEPADCSIYRDDPAYQYELESSNGGLSHNISFNKTYLRILEPGSYMYHVNCTDYNGNENEDTITITWDVTPATITTTVSPTPPINALYPLVYINLSASEDVICRSQLFFDSTDFPDLSTSEAVRQRYESSYMEDFGVQEFDITHDDDVTPDIEEHDNGEYNYLIICEDRAGWLSEPHYESFTVEGLTYMYVTNPRPQGWQNSTNVIIGVSTNRPATCDYSEDYAEDEPTWLELSNTPSYEHETALTLSDNTVYSYQVRCSASDPQYESRYPDGAYIDLGIDTFVIRPTISSIRTSTNTNVNGRSTNEQLLSVRGSVELNSTNLTVRVFSSSMDIVWENSSSISDVTSYALNIKLPEYDGLYYVQSFVVDKAGNKNSSFVANVTMDSAGPESIRVADLDLYGNNYFSEGTFFVYATADEVQNRIEAVSESGYIYNSTTSSVSSSCVEQSGLQDSEAGQELVLLDDASIFSDTNYLEFANQILPHFARYDITQVNNPLFGQESVEVSPVLLDDVSSSTGMLECDTRFPTGWVNMSLSLSTNTAYSIGFRAVDSLGNLGVVEGPYYIIIDSTSPYLHTSVPTSDYIGADDYDYIYAELRDDLSGIDQSSINMTFNGTFYSSEDLSFNGTSQVTGVTLELPGVIEEEIYSVTIEYADMSGNINSSTWTFEIDSNVTSLPEFTMDGDHINGSIHYINQTLNKSVWLVYAEDAPKFVELTHVGLGDRVDEVPPDDVEQPFTRQNNYTFNITLNSTLYEELWYRLNLHSYKRISETLNSSVGQHHFIIRFDTVDPEIAFTDMPYSNTSVDVRIEGTCYDLNMDEIRVSGSGILGPRTTECTDGEWFVFVNMTPGQGDKELIVVATDKAGNAKSDSMTVTVDRDPPSMIGFQIESLSHPVETTWYSNDNATFNWSEPSEDSNYIGYSYVLTTDPNIAPDTTVDTTNRFTNVYPVLSGVWYFRIRAVDSAGNWGSVQSLTIRVDVLAPQFTNIEVLPDETNSVSVVHATIEDPHSGVASTSIAVEYDNGTALGVTTSSVTPNPGHTHAYQISSIPANTEGSFVIRLSATDSSTSANTAVDTNSRILLDNTPPELSELSYLERVGTPYATVSFTTHESAWCRWSATDVTYDSMPVANSFASGEGSTSHETSINPLTAGDYSYYLSCEDELGNDAPTTRISITYDNVAPPLTNILFTPVQYSDGTVNYTASSSITLSGVSEPEAEVETFIGATLSVSTTVDNTQAQWVGLEAWQFVDEDGNSVPAGVMTNGSNLTIEAVDNADYVVYSDVPGHSIMNIASGEYVSFPINTAGTYHFNVSFGTYYTSYYIVTVLTRDNSFSFSQPLNADRMTLLSLLARDTVGNEQTAYHYSNNFAFQVFSDTLAPEITTVSPIDTTMNNKMPLIEAYLTDNGGSGIDNSLSTLLIDNEVAGFDIAGTLTSDTNYFSFMPTENLTDNNITLINLSLNVTDHVGRITTSNWSFTINMLVPSTPIMTLTDGVESQGMLYTNTTIPTVTLTFSERVNINVLDVNGVPRTVPSSDDQMTFVFSAPSHQGVNTILVEATPLDRVGSRSSDTLHYTVDTIAPTLDLISVIADKNLSLNVSYLVNDNVTITITTVDENPNIVFLSGDVEYVEQEISLTTSSHDLYADLDDAQGAHPVTITVRDKVGNENSTNLSFILDTLPPEFLVVDEPRTPTPRSFAPLSGIVSSDTDYLVLRSLGGDGYTDNVTLNRSNFSSGSEVTYSATVFHESVQEGNSYFYVQGSSECDAGEFNDGWVSFGNDIKRYKILDCQTNQIRMGYAPSSYITIKGTFESSYSVGTDVYNNNQELPNGFYEHDIDIALGDNILEAFAYDHIGNSIYDYTEVRRDEDTSLYELTVTISSPVPSDSAYTTTQHSLIASTDAPAISCTATSHPSSVQTTMVQDTSVDYHLDLTLATGDYNYSVTCDPVDEFQTSTTDYVDFSVDVTPPDDVTLNSPKNGSLMTSLWFNWTDISGEENYVIEIASDLDFSNILESDIIPADQTYQTYSEQSLESNLWYFWRVYAVDEVGNYDTTNAEVRAFYFDKYAPATPVIISPSNDGVSNQATINVVGVAEIGSYMTVVVLDENGVDTNVSNGNPSEGSSLSTVTSPYTTASQGDSTVLALGDLETYQGQYLHIEGTYDMYYISTATYVSALDYSVLELARSLSVSVSTSDTLSIYSGNVLPGQFTISSTLTAGLNDIIVTSEDLAGHVSTAGVENVLLDVATPLITNTQPSTNQNTNSTPVSADISDRPELNSGIVHSADLFVDGILVPITLQGSDNKLTFNYLPLGGWSDAEHTMVLYVSDIAGNNATSTWTFTVDGTLPEDAVFVVEDSLGYGEDTFTDNDQPELNVSFANDIVTWHDVLLTGPDGDVISDVTTVTENTKFTVKPQSTITDGEYTLSFTATRNLGDGSQSNPRDYEEVFIVDTLPPQLWLDTDMLTLTNDSNYFVSGTFTESNPASITIWGDVSAKVTISEDDLGVSSFEDYVTLSSESGDKEVKVTLTDKQGRNSTASITVTYDSTNPTVSLTQPSSPTSESPLTISGSVDEASFIEIYHNGLVVSSFEDSDDFTVDVSLGVGNNNEIYALATDTAGNTDYSSTIYVTYDDEGPSVNFTDPKQGDIIRETSTIISAHLDDDYSAVDESTVRMSVNEEYVQAMPGFHYNPDSGDLNYSTANRPLWDGQVNTVIITADDSLGNSNSLSDGTMTFFVDTLLPAMPVIELYSGSSAWPENIVDGLVDNIPEYYNDIHLSFDEGVELLFNFTNSTVQLGTTPLHAPDETQDFVFQIMRSPALQEEDYKFNITYTAIDNGRVVRDEITLFEVDRTAPYLSVADLSQTSSRNITVRGNCSDANPGLVFVQEQNGDPISTSCTMNFQIPFVLSSGEGVKELTIFTDDQAGIRTERYINVTYDSAGPAIERMWQTQIYTNSSLVNIIGKADEQGVTASVYNSENALLGSVVSSYSDTCRTEVVNSGEAGSDIVTVPDANRFLTSEYIEFDHYGFELKRYDITQVVSTALPSNYIVVSPVLLDDVESSAQVCENQNPEGWFSIPITVTQSVTSVWARAFDSLENPSPLSDEITIIYDNVSPSVSDVLPAPNAITASEVTQLSFTVSDSLSPIVKDSITLVFDNEEYDCTTLVCDEGELSIPITLYTGVLAEGIYDATVWAIDYSGNLLNTSWQFTIDDNVTHEPEYTINQSLLLDSIYYIDNISPEVLTVYSDDYPDLVNLTFRGVGYDSDQYGDVQALNAEVLDNQSFNLTFIDGFFNNNNQMPTYRLNLYSQRKSDEGWSATGYHSILMRVDTIAPQLTFEGPTGSNTWENVVLTGTYQDTNIVRVEIAGVGVMDRTITDLISSQEVQEYEFPVNLTDPFTDGNKEFTMTAYDILGHSTAVDVIIVYDRTPPSQPEITSSTHTEDGSSSDDSPIFSWSVSDSDVVGYSIELDDTADTEPDTVSDLNITTATFQNLNDGTWYFHVRAVDSAGNWGPTDHFGFTIDSGLPHFVIDNIIPIYARSSFSVSFNVSEPMSTVAAQVGAVDCTYSSNVDLRYTYVCDVTSFTGQDWYAINTSGTDLVDNFNWEVHPDDLVYIDTQEPSIIESSAQTPTLDSPADLNITTDESATCKYDNNNSRYVDLHYTMAGSGSEYHYASVDVVQGSNTFYVLCQDTAGNIMSSHEEVTIVRDYLAPPIDNLVWWPLFNRNEKIYTNSPALHVGGDSEQEAVISLYLNDVVDQSLTIHDFAAPVIEVGVGTFDPEGPFTVPTGTVVTFTNPSPVSRTLVSTSPCPTSLVIPAYGSYELLMDTTGSCRFQMSIGGEVLDPTLDITIRNQSDAFNITSSDLPEFSLVYLTAVDSLGNVNITDEFLLYQDTTAPSITNNNPESTTNDSLTPVSVVINDDNVGLNVSSIIFVVDSSAHTRCTLDAPCNRPGTTIEKDGDTFTVTPSLPWSDADVAEVNVSVNASDTLGNLATLVWTFVIDKVSPPAPDISIEGELSNSGRFYTALGEPSISLNFTEPVTLQSAHINNQLVSLSAFDSDNQMDFTLPTAGLITSDNNYTFNVSAVKVGLSAVGKWSKTFTRDTIWPNVGINNETTASFVGENTVRVRGSCNDTNFANLTVHNILTVCSAGEFWQDVPLSPGENSIVVTARDILGHRTDDSKIITYDTTPPAYVEIEPIPSPTALQNHTIVGITDPTAEYVHITLWNESGLTSEHNITSWTGPSPQLSSSTLEVEALDGDMQVIIDGYQCASDEFGVGNYLQFDNEWDRYLIDACDEQYNLFTYVMYTVLDLNYSVEGNHLGAVSSYAESRPEGYFTVNVTLQQGDNLVDARAYDNASLYINDDFNVVYDPTLRLGVTVMYPDSVYSYEPMQYSVSATEFDEQLESIPINVVTSLPADCVISHELDSVAFAFDEQMTSSPDGRNHTYSISQDSCGNTHCMVMGNGDWVTHEYSIFCDAPGTGLHNTVNLSFITANVYDRTTFGDFTCEPEQRNACSAGNLEGEVRTSEGALVQGASITVAGLSTTSGPNGWYFLPDVPFGSNTITVSYDGFVTDVGTAFVPERSTGRYDSVLEAYASISGSVTDSVSGDDLQLAVVTYEETGQFQQGETYEFSDLTQGLKTLTAQAPGHSSLTLTQSVDSGESAVLDFILIPYGSITGEILDSVEGTAIDGVTVTASGQSTSSGDDGVYYIGTLDAGEQLVTVKAIGYHEQSTTVQIQPNVMLQQDFNLVPKDTGNLTGIVYSDTGEIVVGATVSVADGEASVSTSVTGADGRYLLVDVYEGSQVVTVSAENYISRSVSVEIQPNDIVSRDFYLQQPGSISGYVMLIGSTDYSGITVDATCGDANVNTLTGEYSVPDVPPGSCTVTANAPGYESSSADTTVPSGGDVNLNLVLQSSSGPIVSGGWD